MAFYSQDILNIKDGKFGKIWMAAHKMTKLTRREVASINVSQCCEDVWEYIDIRREKRPDRRSRKYPRLSLYLSAYLMYGAIIIYNKQCEYLLVDVESIFVSVRHLPKLTDDKVTRRETEVTNAEHDLAFETDYNYYTVMEEAAKLQQQLPEPETWTLGFTHLRSPQRRKSKSRTKKRKTREPSVLEVSREQITIPEREELPSRIDPVMSPQISKDDDFQAKRGQVMELEEMPLNVNDLIASTPRQPADQPSTDRPSRPRSPTQQTTLESPTQVHQSVLEKTPAAMPPPEEIPVAQAVAAESLDITVTTIPEEVPQAQPTRPRRKKTRRSLHLDQFVRPPSPEGLPKRKRKKKGKNVTDQVTQIPKLQIRKNLETGIDTSMPLIYPGKNKEHPSAADLLKIPGRIELRRQPFTWLFSRGATFRRNIPVSEMPVIDYHTSGSSSERSEEAQVPEISNIQPPEIEQPTVPAPELSLEQPRAPGDESFIATRLTGDMSHQEPRTAEESINLLRQTTSAVENLDISAIEMVSMEKGRDADASGPLDPSALNISDIAAPLDSAQKSKGSTSKRKSRSRKSGDDSLELEQAPSYTSLHSMHTSGTSGMDTRNLYNIVEEMVEIPIHARLGEEEYVHLEEDLLKSIEDEMSTSDERRTTFRKLCPPEHFTRREAVSQFTALLGLCTKRTIKAIQAVSFGDIYIIME